MGQISPYPEDPSKGSNIKMKLNLQGDRSAKTSSTLLTVIGSAVTISPSENLALMSKDYWPINVQSVTFHPSGQAKVSSPIA